MTSLFLSAVLLAWALAAIPGAVAAESVRRGVALGFGAALLVQLGSLIGDVVWASIALAGTTILVRNEPLRLLLGIAGALFLLQLACSALRKAALGTSEGAAATSSRGDFATGAVFSLTNPYALAFWLGLGAGIAATAHGGPRSVFTFFAGFFLGLVVWSVAFAALIAGGRRYLLRWQRGIEAMCGVVLGYFGVRLLLNCLRGLRVLRLVLG